MIKFNNLSSRNELKILMIYLFFHGNIYKDQNYVYSFTSEFMVL